MRCAGRSCRGGSEVRAGCLWRGFRTRLGGTHHFCDCSRMNALCSLGRGRRDGGGRRAESDGRDVRVEFCRAAGSKERCNGRARDEEGCWWEEDTRTAESGKSDLEQDGPASRTRHLCLPAVGTIFCTQGNICPGPTKQNQDWGHALQPGARVRSTAGATAKTSLAGSTGWCLGDAEQRAAADEPAPRPKCWRRRGREPEAARLLARRLVQLIGEQGKKQYEGQQLWQPWKSVILGLCRDGQTKGTVRKCRCRVAERMT